MILLKYFAKKLHSVLVKECHNAGVTKKFSESIL